MRTNHKSIQVKALKNDIQLARLARLKAAYAYKSHIARPPQTNSTQHISAP